MQNLRKLKELKLEKGDLMVFKSIEKIKSVLPEVIHIVMFYNDGMVFQTTFDSSKNIPKLGENLAESLSHIKKILDICQVESSSYKKLVYETKEITVIILKLGENSNIALFLKNLKEEDVNYQSIRRYLYRIERLIDMDKIEIDKEELNQKEEEMHKLEELLQSNLNELEKLKQDSNDLGTQINHIKEEIEKTEKELENNEVLLKNRKDELNEIEKDMDETTIEKQKEELEEIEENIKKNKIDINSMKSELKNKVGDMQKISDSKKFFISECDRINKEKTEKSKQILEMKENIDGREKEIFEEKFLE